MFIEVTDTKGTDRVLNVRQIISVFEYTPEEIRINMPDGYIHSPISLDRFLELVK
jgi:hypothetical protein